MHVTIVIIVLTKVGLTEAAQTIEAADSFKSK